MSKTTTRITELVIGIVLFELGSTTLFILGAGARQDAWLAMSIAALLGFLLLLLYLAIYRRDGERDLFDLLKTYMGRPVGSAIAFLFVCYFTYEVSRNLRDLGELTVLTLLDRTPLALVMGIAILVVGNTTRYGPQVLFLTCLVLFPVIVVSYALIAILIPGMGLLHPEFMLPVLERGWKPVWDAAFPEIVSFPFGQMVLFLVFFNLVKTGKGGKLSRAVIIAYLSIALFLIAVNQTVILVLGPRLAENISLPLLETVQLIEIAEVFERMDPVFTMIFFLGLGVKMAAFYNGAIIGMERITGIRYKRWVIPVGAAIYALSFLSPNFTHHLFIGQVVVVSIVYPFFQIALPLLLYLTMLVRRRKA